MDADAPLPLEPIEESPRAVSVPAAPVTAISVREVSRRFTLRSGRWKASGSQRIALDNVTFDLLAGQWGALLGPNGSGKSTLFRMLATLDRPDLGALQVFGKSTVTDADAVRSSIGVVFQRPGLDPLLTVRENLVLQGELCGVVASDAMARASRLADEMGFADRLNERVRTLSGGLARRVDLARALLPEPRLLLLDEPTVGLDLGARKSFLDLLEARRRATGLTILMSTHQIDEAERADEVILLAGGKIVAGGSPADLRSALGGLVLTAGVEAESIVRDAGLQVQRTGSDGVAAGGDASQIERATSELVRRGVAFSVSRPTLADVYLARTGTTLENDVSTKEAA